MGQNIIYNSKKLEKVDGKKIDIIVIVLQIDKIHIEQTTRIISRIRNLQLTNSTALCSLIKGTHIYIKHHQK